MLSGRTTPAPSILLAGGGGGIVTRLSPDRQDWSAVIEKMSTKNSRLVRHLHRKHRVVILGRRGCKPLTVAGGLRARRLNKTPVGLTATPSRAQGR
eukprot:COSAG01_NODE_10282_length_2201_cov_6.031399_2_plen_96_part_00